MQEKKRKKVKEIRNYLKEIIVVKRTEIYETQITSKSRTLVRADVIYNLMLIKKKKKTLINTFENMWVKTKSHLGCENCVLKHK